MMDMRGGNGQNLANNPMIPITARWSPGKAIYTGLSHRGEHNIIDGGGVPQNDSGDQGTRQWAQRIY